jgi:hypothetical protein
MALWIPRRMPVTTTTPVSAAGAAVVSWAMTGVVIKQAPARASVAAQVSSRGLSAGRVVVDVSMESLPPGVSFDDCAAALPVGAYMTSQPLRSSVGACWTCVTRGGLFLQCDAKFAGVCVSIFETVVTFEIQKVSANTEYRENIP